MTGINNGTSLRDGAKSRAATILAAIIGATLVTGLDARPADALVIKARFDTTITSRTNAAVIESAFNSAIYKLDTAFANPATVYVTVSWGSVAGQSLPSGDIGASLDNLSGPYAFNSITHYLTATSKANPADLTLAKAVSHLPGTDPTKLNQFEIPYAEAKAIGLLAANQNTMDGYIGFNSAANFDFNPVGGISAGTYDFQGLADHELAEVLGRITGLQSTSPHWATPYDLYRYTAANSPSFAYGAHAYFSVDGGLTDLGDFNYAGSGDRSDWLTLPTSTDLQSATLTTGRAYAFSSSDLNALDALGWGSWTMANTVLTGAPDTTSPINGAGGVPEPATWGMLLLGFGLAGAATRRRRLERSSSLTR